MDYQCEAVERPAQPVLSIRTRVHVQNLPEVLGKGYAQIAQYLESLGKTPGGDPYVAYYNMNMEDLDMELGFPVSEKVPGQGEIQSNEIPAGKYATCLHIGPYPDRSWSYWGISLFGHPGFSLLKNGFTLSMIYVGLIGSCDYQDSENDILNSMEVEEWRSKKAKCGRKRSPRAGMLSKLPA